MRPAICNTTIVLLAMVMCVSCKNNGLPDMLVDKAMVEAGDNSGELKEFLDRYDGERRAAAEYTVAAVRGSLATAGLYVADSTSVEYCYFYNLNLADCAKNL